MYGQRYFFYIPQRQRHDHIIIKVRMLMTFQNVLDASLYNRTFFFVFFFYDFVFFQVFCNSFRSFLRSNAKTMPRSCRYRIKKRSFLRINGLLFSLFFTTDQDENRVL